MMVEFDRGHGEKVLAGAHGARLFHHGFITAIRIVTAPPIRVDAHRHASTTRRRVPGLAGTRRP
ncbi:hypothetical protein ACFQ8C_36340 [Streptomyces sp. NPDC056503]|uniref:hypothetical protein n=1 Tax=Streptomyces sp. NPDC056503 TaxID=3345842 RepID=UPI00369A05EB